MTEEIWKTHEPSGWKISNMGNAITKHGKAKDMNKAKETARNRNTYIMVNFTNGGSPTGFHVMVCETFHGKKPGEDYSVNHKDGNRWNNRSDNLEWILHSGNVLHSCENGFYRLDKKQLSKPVQAKKVNDEVWMDFESVRELARHLNPDQDLSQQVSSKLKNDRYSGRYFPGWEMRYVKQENLPGEEWKTMVYKGKEYEGYEVSNKGRFKDSKGVIKKPQMNVTEGRGNHAVRISMRGKQISFNQAVAWTFLGTPPEGKRLTRHKDGNINNNEVDNLQWVDHKTIRGG